MIAAVYDMVTKRDELSSRPVGSNRFLSRRGDPSAFLLACRCLVIPIPEAMSFPPDSDRGRQPIFNVPTVMVLLLVAMAAIHLIQTSLLDPVQQTWVILNFAYFPARPAILAGDVLPGAEVWSFLSYGLLHADWGHFAVNAVWMAAFGSPLARRFGPRRFLAFSAVAVIAGALTHLLAHGGEQIPLVGASAAVSAHMAGASRFLFIGSQTGPRSFLAPAASLGAVFRDPRTMTFLGVWFVINVAVGLFFTVDGEAGRIAWEAHIGGFLVGLLLFRLFDPAPERPAFPDESAEEQ